MRKVFVDKVLQLMRSDEEIIFLTGDLGFGSFEVIAEAFPERFYNMGIAEQNMIGTACGLSLAGKKVIVYSIANFATLRVVEQIRNYLLYHNNQVLIVNGGGGFCYGQLGYTHHAIEDISVLKALPGIRVFAPCEETGIIYALDEWWRGEQVCYLRLEKAVIEGLNEQEDIKYTEYGFLVGRPGDNNYILGYGTVLEEALSARQQLILRGVNVSVIAFNELKYIPDQIYTLVGGANKVLYLEENSSQGGMGEHFIAECMVNKIRISHVYSLGVKDYVSDTIGDQKYLRKIHKLDTASIIHCFGD